jgi:hypothetical protein
LKQRKTHASLRAGAWVLGFSEIGLASIGYLFRTGSKTSEDSHPRSHWHAATHATAATGDLGEGLHLFTEP